MPPSAANSYTKIGQASEHIRLPPPFVLGGCGLLVEETLQVSCDGHCFLPVSDYTGELCQGAVNHLETL